MSGLTEHAAFVKFFEESKGIKLRTVEKKSPNVYLVTTHNDQFKVNVYRKDDGTITQALISYDR